MIINKYNCLNFSFFLLKKSVFYQLQIFFLLETGWSLIDLDVIFSIQSSEFTKSPNFRSISLETVKKLKKFILHLKSDGMVYFDRSYNMVYFDRSELYLSYETIRNLNLHFSSSSSSVAPAGLRGELRLWREGPPRTRRPAPPLPTNRAVLLCVWGWSACTLEHPCVVLKIVHFYGVRPEVFEWLYVVSNSVCLYVRAV